MFQALSQKPGPVGDVSPPYEARRSAVAGHAIGVALEPVVAISDDRKILIARLGVRGATGTGGTLECHFVCANSIVTRLVFSAVVGPTALVDQHDAASSSSDGHLIAGHFHVLRRSKGDICPPEPAPVSAPIVPNDVVADDRIERNLVENPDVLVVLDEISLIDNVSTVNIAP